MKKLTITLAFLFIAKILLFSQDNYTQTIRGKILDQNAQIPLIGATVVLYETSPPIGTITDEYGNFKIEDVPVGRCALNVSYVGYKPKALYNLLLKSGKELVLNIELEENIEELEEVVIKANGGKEKPTNDMALISTRSFSVEETERYAGSWGDPARMASNFAGVSSAGDQRNDIIIRANSPFGLIWRLEGIPIPSPNHFDVLGSTGGPVSILNNNLLTRSDFYTSVFPAEYGNGTSGVFDLKMRNGNNQKREYVAQLGFGGFELGAEGPFIKGKNSSYLINYRYSMLGLVANLLWVEGLPYYQDLSFKFNFPTKKGRFTLFGIGGMSHIEFFNEDTTRLPKETTYELIAKPASKTGVIGLQHVQFLSEETRIINTIAYSTRQPKYQEDSLENGKKTLTTAQYDAEYNSFIFSSKIISKLSAKNIVDAGFIYYKTFH